MNILFNIIERRTSTTTVENKEFNRMSDFDTIIWAYHEITNIF